MPWFVIPSSPARYDIWVDLDGQNQRHVETAVAILLGWDPRRAEKMVKSGSPIRERVRRGEAEYLRRRFADWGLRVRFDPDLPERPGETEYLHRRLVDFGSRVHVEADLPYGYIGAFLGLVTGVISASVLMGIDPLGVTTFEEPQGVDIAERIAAFERWRSSIGVILGELIMAWIPLLVSGLCGVFAHSSLPASIPASLLRMVGVASLLAFVVRFGTPVVERVLGTGQSSDMQGALAGIAFMALCLSLAAPLSSAVTRRRSRCEPIQAVDEGKRLA